MKQIISAIWAVCLFCAVLPLFSGSAENMNSITTIDNNIDYREVYKAAVDDAMKKHNEAIEDEMEAYTSITYALSDITGDGVCELLIRQSYAKHYIEYWVYGTDGTTSYHMGDFSCDSFDLYGYKRGVLYLDSYKGDFSLGLAEWTGDGFNNITLFEGTFDRDGDPPTLEDLVSHYDPSRLLDPIPEFLDLNEW